MQIVRQGLQAAEAAYNQTETKKKIDLMNQWGWSQEDTDIDMEYVMAVIGLLNAHKAMIAYLQSELSEAKRVLRPFAFTSDELYETQTFRDDELIFLRPNDDNDSVKHGWRKERTFADVRRASEFLARETE